jgi:hypothetical protein
VTIFVAGAASIDCRFGVVAATVVSVAVDASLLLCLVSSSANNLRNLFARSEEVMSHNLVFHVAARSPQYVHSVQFLHKSHFAS